MKKILAFILGGIMCLGLAGQTAMGPISGAASAEYVPEFNVKEFLRAGECTEEQIAAGKCKESYQEMGYLEQEEDSEISPAAEIILKIIDMLVMIIGSVAVLVLIIGGLMLATASGNEQQIQKGKDAMKYAIAGLVVTFLSFITVTFVQSILK